MKKSLGWIKTFFVKKPFSSVFVTQTNICFKVYQIFHLFVSRFVFPVFCKKVVISSIYFGHSVKKIVILLKYYFIYNIFLSFIIPDLCMSIRKESAKLRGLLGNVGYVGAWVAWVRGCVGCVGQIFTWVAWGVWVKIFLTLVSMLRGSYFLRGLRGLVFLHGWTFFAWAKNFCEGLNFSVGQFFL